MKFTALAFLTAALCISVQASRDSVLNKRQGIHSYDCTEITHEIAHKLNKYENKLKDVSHKNYKYFQHRHSDTIKSLEEHAAEASYYIDFYHRSCRARNSNDGNLYTIRAHCAQIRNDQQRINAVNYANPEFSLITQSVLSKCEPL
ncbi:hypothetical protein K501DRAFT_275773 [Backusella circina FSU 941]|nr:hypothetical protein K501DRAFT_275773 [Backusella circina FSU 941]